MRAADLPLLDLFYRLRAHGLPLGMEEYFVVLRALRGGFGIESYQALEELCCTLWAKSTEEHRLIRHLLEQVIGESVSRSSIPPIPDSFDDSFDRAEPPASSPVSDIPRATDPSRSDTIVPDLVDMDEPVQVVQAIRHSVQDEWEVQRPRRNVVAEYFPVTRRQMKQSWRYLRRMVREGPRDELDVDGTVEKVSREGFLLEPVLQPSRLNRTELVLLIDQDGSMTPFHSLTHQLVETAQRGGQIGRTHVYYFHDYPDDYLYLDPIRLEAIPTLEFLRMLSNQTALLIVSDGGAARGYLDEERAKRTEKFVQLIRTSIRYYAWLNPMPHQRWQGSTAGQIARSIPMFEMSRAGLDAAISALRGQYAYWERMYSWMLP